MEIHPARLSGFAIFRGVPTGDLLALVSAGEGLEHQRGDVLFREGSRAKDAYLVIQGRLGVYLGEGIGERLIGEVHKGEIVGEAGLMNLAARRNATVRALTDCDLLKISPRTVMELSQNPAMVAVELYLLEAMARRIRSANLRLEEALSPPPAATAGTIPPRSAAGSLPPRSTMPPQSTIPPRSTLPPTSTLPPGSPLRPTMPPGLSGWAPSASARATQPPGSQLPPQATQPPPARATLPGGDKSAAPAPKSETLTQTLLRILGGKS